MVFTRGLIVAFVVIGVLDLITKRKQKKSTGSLKSFVVRAPIDMAFLGTVGMLVIVGMILLGEYNNEELPIGIWVVVVIVAVVPSLSLMLAPIKGVWDVIVKEDDITVVKGFVYRRHWKFSNITYGKVGRGGMKVYVEGRQRKAFFVDGMCEHYTNFVKRMEKEGKEIRYPEIKENSEMK